MAKESSVVIRNLTKEYVTHEGTGIFKAVDSVSVDINNGQFVTLLGPSGCGKTTILRMVAGFESVTSGDILLNGQRINDVTPDKRDTAMVFQSYALFPHYNVYDNVAYGLINKNMGSSEIEEKVMNMLELVGLKGMEKRSTNQLSGGQQQRVALARALVMEPSVLLFDEPLSNLDAKLRVYMRTEIRKIQQRLGLTSIYVTHDQSEAMAISDKVIIMNKGHIEQVGSPTEIYQHPKTRFVADFIGSANFVDGTVKRVNGNQAIVNFLGADMTVEVEPGEVQAGDAVDVVIRPEAVELTPQAAVMATVKRSTFMGAVQEYELEVGGVTLDVEDFSPLEKHVYKTGEQAGLSFKTHSLHVIKK